jgi:tetratricopeptide (TPR) repeat protein
MQNISGQANIDTLNLQNKTESFLKSLDDKLSSDICCNRADLLIAKGATLIQICKPEDAKKCFEEVLKLDDKNPTAYEGLSNYYMAKCDLEQALRYAEEVVKLNPNIWNPAFNRVMLLIYFKRYEEALSAVEILIEKFGNKYEPYNRKDSY